MTDRVSSLFKAVNLIRVLGFAYAAMFFFTVTLGYIPGFTNEAGQLFGLFEIELKDDMLHLGSGIWATVAAWYSTRATVFYFKTFGTMYALDGLLGLITGHGYLDGGIFLAWQNNLTDFVVSQPYVPFASIFFAHGTGGHDMLTKLLANLPHIMIGGSAVYIGFVLSQKFADDE